MFEVQGQSSRTLKRKIRKNKKTSSSEETVRGLSVKAVREEVKLGGGGFVKVFQPGLKEKEGDEQSGESKEKVVMGEGIG